MPPSHYVDKLFAYREDEKLIELVRLHPCLHDPHYSLYKDPVAKEMAWKEIAASMKKQAVVCKKRWKNIRDTYVRRVKRIRNGDLPKSPYSPKWDLPFLRVPLQDDTDSSDIKIQSVESFPDAGGETSCISESMDSDADTSTNPRFRFSTMDSSEDVGIPSTNSGSVDPMHLKSEKEHSPPPVEAILGIMNCNSSEQENDDSFSEKVSTILGKSCEQKEELLRKLFLQREEDSLDLFFRSVAMSVRSLRPDLVHEAKIRILQLLAELGDA